MATPAIVRRPVRLLRRTGALLAVLVASALLALGCGANTDDRATVAEHAPGEDAAGDERALSPAADEVVDAGSAELSTSDAPASTAPGAPDAAVPDVTAGSVDDNELWDEYLLYRQEFDTLGLPVSPIPVEGRQILRVVDGTGRPVLGADLRITDPSGTEVARLRTYADGRALFHPTAAVDPDSQSRATYRVRAAKGDVVVDQELPSDRNEHEIVLEAAPRGGPRVDVLFLVDTTGSMSDEIERLKANVISVAERIAELPGEPDVRFALTVYRDRGEEYVTRTLDFTGDVDAFADELAGVVADGGGDTPEALGAGLDEAVRTPSWRGDDTVKLVFLVADAAPHLRGEPGYEDEPDYAEALVAAAAEGIKVLPIASSGLEPQGEYVFRQLAQVTLGRFVFLTYGPDGSSPGTSTPHAVSPEDYDVLALDDLVVQLVADELVHLA